MPSKLKVRYVKFSPEEMAYEVPRDVRHLKFRRVNPPLVLLEDDVARVFRDSGTVNAALRKVIELQNLKSSQTKRKKSA